MLAGVFLMQPVAQLAAYLVGYGALHLISTNWGLDPNETDHDRAAPVIDAVWRCVIGNGSILAVIAVFARWSIPETPRYLLEIEEGPQRAFEAARWVSGKKNTSQPPTKKMTRGRSLFRADLVLAIMWEADPQNRKRILCSGRQCV
jgi:hypothetical protein